MTDELVKVVHDSAKGGLFLVFGTAIATAIMAITSILTGRLLNPQLYGQYALALVVPQLLFLLQDLGMSRGIIKFTATFRAKGETSRLKRIIKYCLIVRASIGVLIFAINYFLADFLASFILQRPELAIYVRIGSVAVLLWAIEDTATAAFVGLDRTEYSAFVANMNALAKAVTTIGLVLLGFSVSGAMIGYVAGSILAAIVAVSILAFLLRKGQDSHSDCSVSNDLKTMVSYGAPLYVSALLIGLIPIYQNVILAIFSTDIDIGNFRAAGNFMSLIAVISGPIGTALLAAFSKIDPTTNSTVKAFFKLANKYTTMIIIPLASLLIIFSQEIIRMVYGQKYSSAPAFLATYCLFYFLVALGYLTLDSLFNGLSETKTTLKMSLIYVFALLILSPLLAKPYGVQGVIAAFVTATAAAVIYGLYTARRKFQIEIDTRSTVKIFLISAVSAVPPLLLLNLASLPSLFDVVAGGLLYLFTYITLMPVAKIVTTSELQMAMDITQKIRPLALIAKPILKYLQRIMHTTTHA